MEYFLKKTVGQTTFSMEKIYKHLITEHIYYKHYRSEKLLLLLLYNLYKIFALN